MSRRLPPLAGLPPALALCQMNLKLQDDKAGQVPPG
jgi:hypothetical protein